MKNSLVKNYIYDMSYRLVLIIVPLILTPYTARVVGAKGLGIYGFTSSIITLLCVFAELGTATYTVNLISKSRNDMDKLSFLYSEFRYFRCATVLFCYFILSIFLIIYKKYEIAFLINSFVLFADFFDISWFLEGNEDFRILSLRNIFIKLLTTILIFIFVRSPRDIFLYIGILSISNVIGNISVLIKKGMPLKKFNTCNIKRHVRPMFFYSLPQFAVYINAVLDKALLGFLVSDTSLVAFYSQPERVIQIGQSILSSLGYVLFPRISLLIGENKKKEAEELIYRVCFVIGLIAIPMVIGLIGTSDIFIPVFLGEGYNRCILILIFFAPIIFIQGIRAVVCTPLFIPFGLGNKYNLSVLISAVMNIVLDIALIPFFQEKGAVVATIMSELFTLCIQFIFLRKHISVYKVLKNSCRYTWGYFFLIMNLILLRQFVRCNVMGLIILIISSIFVYFLAIVIFYRKDCFVIINSYKKRK